MNTTKFSNILLDKSPKKINNACEKIIDTLFTVNEVVRELNSIDFCNPLGYILTKALPPESAVSNKLKQYGDKVTGFINKTVSKFELNTNTNTLPDDIEELRLSFEDLIPDEELKRIIPGGDGILKVIQNLNDSLVITNTIISINDKKKLIKSFTNKLIPLSNPINLTEALLHSQVDNLNNQLKNFIKPERFKKDLLKLIKLVIQIDKTIAQIQSIIILMNKIIKSINVLIKITKLTISILKKIPMPAQYVTVGLVVTSSSKVSNFEQNINELEKLLNSVSIFLSISVIKQIKRIRIEIFTLLIGLNQLYENLSSCPYFAGDILLEEVKKGVDSLNNNLNILEELFPSIKDIPKDMTSNLYKGYNIVILKEETTKNNTSLIRRRVIVTNSQNILEYESIPTYASDDQILIKEGQFYIDSKFELGTSDNGTDNITDQESEILMEQIGMNSKSFDEANKKEIEINKLLFNQIQNNPIDKKIYNSLNGNNINPNNLKVERVKKIINTLIKNQTDPRLIQNRLSTMANSLLKKGYTQSEIQLGLKYHYSNKYNITIINNNITISKN